MARFTQAGGSGSGEQGPQGPQGPQGIQGEPGDTGSQGPAGDPFGIYYLGDYVSTNGYVTDIAVVRGSDGQLYLAKASGQLGDPINYQSNGQWEVWIPKGADGTNGIDALWNFTGPWVNGIDYGPGSVVEYQGSCYYHPTGQFSSYNPPGYGWLLVASKGEDAPVGTGANGEVTRWSPNFTATGLTFTGTGATYPTYNSYYVKNGRMVSFNIEVDLSTVTNFGTGQYKLQLPFTPQFGFNHFSGWAWADPNVSPDVGTGHTILNADTAGVTDVLDLHYLKQSGGANSPIREGLFVQGTPVTLSTISNIYVNGTYITAE